MLVKHSSVEFGIKWWFLHDVRLGGATAKEISKMSYDDLRQAKACVFIKRFESEAELDVEAAIKYGVTPIAVADGRFNAACPAEPEPGGPNTKALRKAARNG